MINVLKRLAELDSTSPQSEKTMTQEQSLATVTNIAGKEINECGPMGMGGMPTTPASFSINATAQNGDEVASMLTQIMNLAGVKPVSQEPAMAAIHKEIELEPAHIAEPDHGSDMANTISMIDKMNGPEDDMSVAQGDVDNDGDHDIDDHAAEFANRDGAKSPIGDMADDVRDMADEMADEGQNIAAGFDTATTTPDEKVEPHKYGNDQVTPKPKEPVKKAGGGNPEEVEESVIAAQLLKDYQQFVSESNK